MVSMRFVVVSLTALLWPLVALGQARHVAVMPPEGGAPPEFSAAVATALANAARESGRDVARPAVPIEEVRLTVECPEPSPACTAVVGKNLGVEELVLTRLTREGDGWSAEATLFDVGGARAVRQSRRHLAAAPGEGDLRQLGQGLFVTEQPQPPPVEHRWQLHLRRRTWIAGAAGAGLLVVGGIFGALSRSTQGDLDATLPPAPWDAAAIRSYVDLADRGQAYATAANVFFAVGGAALVATGVLFYLDWRRVEVQPAADAHGVMVTLRSRF